MVLGLELRLRSGKKRMYGGMLLGGTGAVSLGLVTALPCQIIFKLCALTHCTTQTLKERREKTRFGCASRKSSSNLTSKVRVWADRFERRMKTFRAVDSERARSRREERTIEKRAWLERRKQTIFINLKLTGWEEAIMINFLLFSAFSKVLEKSNHFFFVLVMFSFF